MLLLLRNWTLSFQSSRSLRTATRSANTSGAAPSHFNPRSPCGPRHLATLSRVLLVPFQSSRSLRTATGNFGDHDNMTKISILAVLADRDAPLTSSPPGVLNFNPRGPCGPRLGLAPLLPLSPVFQSSRSLRTATRHFLDSLLVFVFQSSRSLRTATYTIWTLPQTESYFNPRGPCGPRRGLRSIIASGISISILAVLADRDLREENTCRRSFLFQSSRSLRTATPGRFVLFSLL